MRLFHFARHEKDSILFNLSLIKTEHGENINSFVKAPVDRHIRSWQESLSRYQTWDYISGGVFDKDIQFSIYFGQNLKSRVPCHFFMRDSISVCNLTNGSWTKRTFILLKGNP